MTIALMAIFIATLAGMLLTGWAAHNEQLAQHGTEPITLGAYSASGEFISALFENWESEFLQMGAFVILTAMLFQRGSAESRDPDNPTQPKDPAVPLRPFGRWLYAHSLGLALMGLFVLSFLAHLWGSAEEEAQAAALHQAEDAGLWEHMGSAQFWFQSFQNWQSEFLSAAVLIVLTIFLRYHGSTQSKPLLAKHGDTGAE